MFSLPAEPFDWAFVLLGALIAGFITGFAGFGSALVASGFWFHALPAGMVPPLVALASVGAQTVGLIAVRSSFDWRRAAPYLLGGVVGVPAGVALLRVASPELLKTTVGAFLVMYAAFQLSGAARFAIGQWGGRGADAAVGVGGGFLGGFSGLSGPLPLIWLQLRGGKSAGQRATYQPFNLVVLALAALGMGISGQIDSHVLVVSAAATPVTLLGAWAGVRAYAGVGEELFRRVVLCLLMASGAILLVQNVMT